MKESHKMVLYTETLITAKTVIPAKAGIQTSSLRKQGTSILRTGFPRIKYPVSSTGQAKAGLVKPGMTTYIRLMSLCTALTFIIACILFGTPLIEPMMAYGQSRGKAGLSQESGRDPFVLPSGVRLHSKSDTNSLTKGASSTTEIKPMDIPLKVNAILISDHIRLASIDQHIVTVGDLIHDEKILEIKNDRVILGKGDKKRTLLLSQSPVRLTIEEK
jgi:hypothetical protein